MLIMAIAASSIGIGTALIVGPEGKESLCEFYTRTRPPGFWGPIADEVGDDSRFNRIRLYRGIGAVIASALSIFSMLVGVGSLICGSPPPTWFPWRGVWIGLCLVVGVGLVPVWYWLGFSETSAEPHRPPPEHPDRSEAAEKQVGSKEEGGDRRGDYNDENRQEDEGEPAGSGEPRGD